MQQEASGEDVAVTHNKPGPFHGAQSVHNLFVYGNVVPTWMCAQHVKFAVQV